MTSESTIGNSDLTQILAKTTDAANGGLGGLSTCEALVAALVLNRRTGWPVWNTRLPRRSSELVRTGLGWDPQLHVNSVVKPKRRPPAAADKALQDKLVQFSAQKEPNEEELDFSAAFITASRAPGYRDVSLTFDLKAIGPGRRATFRASLRVNPRDGEAVVGEIIAAHRFAWARRRPIDAGPEEERPPWIGTP